MELLELLETETIYFRPEYSLVYAKHKAKALHIFSIYWN